VELILDFSHCMWNQINGESKISIAKGVLKQNNGLPEEINVGLRLYGHQGGYLFRCQRFSGIAFFSLRNFED